MKNETMQRVLKTIREKNFDNDLYRIFVTADRYNIDEWPIRIGTNTLSGSMIEFMVATTYEIDRQNDEINLLKAEVAELKKLAEKPAKADKKKESSNDKSSDQKE